MRPPLVNLPHTKLYRIKVMKMMERHERELSEVLDDPTVTCHAEFATSSEILLEQYRAKNKEARNQLNQEHLEELKRWG